MNQWSCHIFLSGWIVTKIRSEIREQTIQGGGSQVDPTVRSSDGGGIHRECLLANGKQRLAGENLAV